MALSLFCNQAGEGFTSIPEMVTPQYLGASLGSFNQYQF
jgi:hypothetical protein